MFCVVCGIVCSAWFVGQYVLRGLWDSMFDVFWVLFGLFSVGVFWPQVSIVCVCVCVCPRARGLAHLVFLQERTNILTNVKECREGKLIWRVSLF
jgi:hypothetical protein